MSNDLGRAGAAGPGSGAAEGERRCRKCGAVGDGAPYLFRLTVRGHGAAAHDLFLRLCRACAMGLVDGPAFDAYVAELTAG